MLQTIFIEYILTCGALHLGSDVWQGETWNFYLSQDNSTPANILLSDEISKREADIICNKLKIRRMPSNAFDF